MTRPDLRTLFRVLEATWPPAATHERDGWLLRDGAGGGKRVSAAVAGPNARPEDAPDLVQIRPGDEALDAALAERGYRTLDETLLYLAPIRDIAAPLPHGTAYWTTARLAIIEDIWTSAGIDAARLAVMDRACAPKAWLICRVEDRAAAAGFVAMNEDVAMVHAIEVLPEHRRRAAGRLAMRAAANWGMRHGAEWLALAVTSANTPGRALYEGLGMSAVGRYHYRVRET